MKRKRLLVLILSALMMISYTVPSFAETVAVPESAADETVEEAIPEDPASSAQEGEAEPAGESGEADGAEQSPPAEEPEEASTEEEEVVDDSEATAAEGKEAKAAGEQTDLDDIVKIATIADQTYTGAAIEPAVILEARPGFDGVEDLVAGTDYTVTYTNNKNVGEATVKVTGIGDYKGTIVKTFGISAADLADVSAEAIANQFYTGETLAPEVSLKLGAYTLVSGTDYDAVYSDNTDVGQATIAITGKGNFTGAKTVTFNIVKATVKIGGTSYETLEAAVAAANALEGEVTIDLLDDVTWTTGASHGSTPLLTADSSVTKLTVKGNGHTLTAVGQGIGSLRAANNGTLSFEDMTIKDESVSYAENSWEHGYLEFGGKLNFTNVNFVNAIMLTQDNGQQVNCEAVFTDCSFNSNAANEYDVWVSQGDATFNHCSFTGYRGAKTHEAYGSEVGTLTFNQCEFKDLSKKPGLAVGTVNADTTVILDSCTFTNVQAGDQGLYILESDTDTSAYNLIIKGTAVVDGQDVIVARIGEQGFLTVEAAFAAVKAGDTLEILKAGNYTLPGSLPNMTLQGNVDGVAFTHTGNGNISKVPDGITFKNLTFNFGTQNYHGFQHAGTIRMEGCTINGKLFSYADMDFTDCTFNAPGTEASGISSKDYSMWAYSGNITYTGCTFNAAGKVLNVYNESGTTRYVITATNCAFHSTEKNKAAFNVKETSGSKVLQYTVNINNCTADENFPAVSATETLTIISGLVQVDDRVAGGTLNGGEIVVNVDGTQEYITPKITRVARIGEEEYLTLADAIAAVPADGTETTIQMIADEAIAGNAGVIVPAEKNIVLDLNGKTITGYINENKAAQVITNKGTLTITDTSAGKNGKIVNDAAAGVDVGSWPEFNYATNIVTNSGTLTINEGTLENTANGSICYAVDNNSTTGNAILNVNGGLLKTDYCAAVRLFCNSTTNENTLNMTGGTIDGASTGFWVQLPGSSGQAKKATLNISGGTISGASYAFYDYSGGDVYDAVHYTITGGTFEGVVFSYGANIDIQGGTFTDEVAIKQAKASDVSVSGGYFHADCYTYGDNASEGFITGGTFKSLTYEYEGTTYDSDWIGLLHKDYTYKKLENGDYQVVKKEIAQIGDVIYPSLQAAIDAAHEMTGDVTVTLLADVTEVAVIHQKAGLNLTVDGRGKTLTGQLYVDGDGRYDGADTLTIQNFKFAYDAATYDDAFIDIPSTKTTGKIYTTGKYNYAHNVTVKDCEFTGEGTTTVAVRVASAAGAHNVTLTGNTVTGGHSFAQLTGVKDLTITGNTVSGVKNGINVSGGDGTATISGNTLTADASEGYTVRFKDNCTMTATLADNTLSGGEGIVNNAKGDSVTAITSGYYAGPLTQGNSGKIVVTGGYFTIKPDIAVCGQDANGNQLYPIASGNSEYPYTVGEAVAKDDQDNLYGTLPDAVAAVREGTITLLKDTGGAGVFMATADAKNLTIDLDGHTYTVSGPAVGSTGTENQGLHLEKGNAITLKNGTVTSTADSGVVMLVQNYADLTLENVTLDGTKLPGSKPYTLSNNCGQVVIGDGTTITAKEGGYAFDVCVTDYYPDGTQVTVKDGAVINGDIQYDVWGSIPAANKATLNIEGGTINGTFDVEAALAEEAKTKLTITGGQFKDDTGNQYNVPTGKALKQEEDGYYRLTAWYTVSFDADNGTSVDPQIVFTGEKATKPATDPVKDGYNFDGWYLGETAYDFETPVTGDITLKAKWKQAVLTLSPTTRNVVAGNSAALPSVKIDGKAATEEQLAKITWTTSDETIVRIDPDGKVAYLAAGTATLTAKYYDSEATCVVTVQEAAVEYTMANGTVKYLANVDHANISGSGTYKLLKDITATTRIVPGMMAADVTIDLNGHTLTSTATDCAILLSRNGTASSHKTFALVDSSEEKGGKLVVNEAANLAIQATGKYNDITIGEGAAIENGCVAILSENQTLTVNGTIHGGDDFAIATNGSSTKNAVININDGAVLASDVTAIYLPGTGTTTISGGSITGATAVYQKSGVLNITGGTLKGTGEAVAFIHNENGANATGDAIVVEACDYPGGAPVTSITGGIFESVNALTVASYSQDPETYPAEEHFVTGGAYVGDHIDPKAIPVGKTLKQSPEDGYYYLKDIFTVTFDPDNGEEPTEVQVIDGDPVAKPVDPVKEGYDFKGWNVGDTAYDFEAPVTGNLNLKAAWELKTYTVTFVIDEEEIKKENVAHFTPTADIKPEDPTKDNYEFNGWVPALAKTVTSDAVYTATWKGKEKMIVYSDGMGNVLERFTVEYGQDTPAFTKTADIPTREGYRLDEENLWIPAVTEKVEKDAVYELNWIKQLTVTFDPDNGEDPVQQTVDEGKVATKPAVDPLKEGYGFGGWYVGNNEYDFSAPVTADLTIKAKWNINKYTVKFDTDGGTAVEDQTVEYNGTAIEPVTVKEGFVFLGWYLNEEPFDFATKVKQDLNLKAKWANAIWQLTTPYTPSATLTTEGATFENFELAWYPQDPSVGRYQDGYWVGMLFTAPEAVNADNISNTTYSNDGGQTWKSFDAAKDSGDTYPAYMQAWVPVDPQKLEQVFVNGTVLTWNYQFRWNGSEESTQSFVITVDPKNVKLTKEGQTELEIADGKILVHSALKKVEAVPATCEEAGTEAYWTCEVCGKLFSDEAAATEIEAPIVIPATGHAYGEWTQTKAPTCTEAGEEQRVCANDPTHIETREIAATGHNLTPVAKKPATCEEAGTEAYWICETCKKLFSDETATTEIEEPIVIPATGHAYGEWTQTKAPTCTEAGEEQRVCANDATHIETRAIEATGHAYGDWTQTKAPTCTEAGEEQRVCANDATHIETRAIAATGHNLTPVAKKPATCEEAGTEAYWICETCKKLFSDETAATEIEEPIVIPATGHAYGEWTQTKAPTCTEAGEEQRVCANDPTHIETREIAATGHDWNDWVEVKPATCEETGFRYRTCKNSILHIEQETIPATGHKLTPVAKKPATCEEEGAEAYWICETCKKLFSDEAGTTVIEAPTVIPATGHAYGEWTQTKAPTCTEAGEEQRVCSNDPTHIETRAIAAIGHAYGEWTQTKAPTCTEAGEEQRVCSNDPTHIETRAIEATGHAYGEWTQTKAPTCTEAGEEQRVCANDATHIETREIEATGHAYGEWTQTKAPTCTEAGEEQRVCANDATHIETRAIAAIGHNLKPVAKKPATCEEAGTEAYWICETCKKLFSDEVGTAVIEAPIVIPATGHAYGDWTQTKAPTCTEAGEEQRVCANDPTHIETREIAATGHDWNDWVEVKPATCEETGFRYRTCKSNTAHIEQENIPATGHKLTPVAKKPATCEEEGAEVYWICETCKKLFSDEAGTTVIEAPTVIPAIGHAYGEWTQTKAPTCTEAGEEQRVCANDPTHIETRAIEAIGHAYGEWTQTKAPTCTEAGEEQRVCANDATHIETREIAATGHAYGEWTQTKAPTCTEAGEEQRVCANDATHIETREIAAIGHKWAQPAKSDWSWSADLKTAKVTIHCENDAMHTQDLSAKVESKVTKEATPTANGVRTYTATAKTPDGKTLTDTRTEVIPKTAKEIQAADVTVSNVVYNGAAQKTAVVKVDGKTLKEGTDYTATYKANTNVGKATVTVEGKGSYYTVKPITKTFQITPASIKNAQVSGISAKTYTGSAITQKPVVKMTLNEKPVTLKSGTDYTVTYKNNTKVGTATVTITGKGNFKDTVNRTFKINAASIAKATVSGLSDQVYDGTAKKPVPTVKLGDKTLKAGTDYTVIYKNNTNAGTATVTITGKGNYAGTLTKTFKITMSQAKLERFAGANRYETAFQAADELKKVMGVSKFSAVVVADGQNFPDALASAYLAKVKKAPTLLTTPSRFAETQSYIKKNLQPGGTIYIVGGTGSVPEAFRNGLAGFKIKRLGGKDRYETDLLVLQEAGIKTKEFIVVDGTSFEDALSASATGMPVLLVYGAGTDLREPQVQYLSSLNREGAARFYLVGGTDVISGDLQRRLSAYGSVERVGSGDAYDRSLAIARKFFPGYQKHINLAGGENFADGLAGGPVAMAKGGPLILTNNTAATFNKALAYAKAAHATEASIFGGTVWISDKVAETILQTGKEAWPAGYQHE